MKFLLRSKNQNIICTQKVGKLRENIHLINSSKDLITSYENYFLIKNMKRSLESQKFSAKISSQLYDKVSVKISKKKYTI